MIAQKLNFIQMVKGLIPYGIKTLLKWGLIRFQVVEAKIYRRMVLSRIRRKVREGRRSIKVVFLVSEISKWKCQSVYDLMKVNPKYEPVIGLYMQDADFGSKNVAQIKAGMERAREFFNKRGCRVAALYDMDKMQSRDLQAEKPDIVIYQQPWNVILEMLPIRVAKYALPCYVPYYVPNYYNDDLAYRQLFHRFLAHNFVLNENEKRHGLSVRGVLDFAGDLQVVGHPMLDEFCLNPPKMDDGKYVIYAPHFTFKHPNNPVLVHYSTFLDSGERLLQYAKGHPEMHWVFKPHPRLKIALRMPGIWSEDKIAEYYGEWAKIGQVCEDGDYMKLFREARAMITDCGSFLSEFAVTRRPIIHLINPDNKLAKPELFETYYQVHNQEELMETLKRVLEDNDDYKRDERLAALDKANLTGTYAAKNIMDFFAKEFGIQD